MDPVIAQMLTDVAEKVLLVILIVAILYFAYKD